MGVTANVVAVEAMVGVPGKGDEVKEVEEDEGAAGADAVEGVAGGVEICNKNGENKSKLFEIFKFLKSSCSHLVKFKWRVGNLVDRIQSGLAERRSDKAQGIRTSEGCFRPTACHQRLLGS